MPNHHHAHIQDIARAAFSFALLAVMALATFVTSVAWAAPTSGATDDADTPQLTATLATTDGGQEACGDGDVRLVCTREFTPTDASGTVAMSYQFDASALKGRTVAITEELRRADGGPALATYDGIASHNEIRFPSLSSKAVVAREGTTIRDVLSYANLMPGLEYVATGTLHVAPDGESDGVDAQTGDALLAADGHVATAEAELDASGGSGSVEVPIVVDARALAGHSVIARAYVHAGGDVIRADADEEGIVRFPKLDATLCDEKSGAHVTSGDGAAILCDTVSYTGLTPGAQHALKVTIVDATTGDAVDDGASSASVSFVPDSVEGTILVSVPLAAKGLSGSTVASTETLTCDGAVTAERTGGRVDAGRVRVAKASAVARSVASGDQEVPATEDAEVSVAVSCENLQPGLEYEVACSLFDADNGKDLGTDGAQATVVSTIVPEGESASVEAKLSIDARELAGRSVVARATVTLDGHDLASCEANTLRIPSIATNPHAEGSESTEVAPAQRSKVVDSVTYTNLIPGKEYVIEGELVDARTGKPAVATVQTQGQATAKQSSTTPSSAKTQDTPSEPTDATAVWVTDDKSYHLDERCGSASGTKRQTTLGIAKATGKTRCRAEDTNTVAHQTEPAPAANAGTQTEGRQEERPARTTARFTPAEQNGAVDVTYEIDTTGLEGTKLVALVTLSRDGHVVVDSRAHTDGRRGVTVTDGPADGDTTGSGESMGQTGTGILPLVAIGTGIALVIGGVLVARTLDEEDGEDGK